MCRSLVRFQDLKTALREAVITISVVLLYYKSNDKKTLLHHHFIIWMRKNQFLDILKNVKSHIEKLLKVKMLLVLKF